MIETTQGRSGASRVGPPPGPVMWVMVAVGALVYTTNYTDKTVISAVAPQILEQFRFTAVELGVVFTAFALTYTFLQPLLAWLADVWGPRRMVTAMVAWYAAFTVLTGFMLADLRALAATRALTGVGESASMPAVTGGVTSWVPRQRRAMIQGVLHACTRLGAAITLPIAVTIYLAFGITGPFVFFGLATFVVAALWLAVFRPAAAAAGSRAAGLTHAAAWKRILTSRSLWALCLADLCYFYTLNIYLTWLPTFLVKERHFSLLNAGLFGALPFIGGSLGGIIGGHLSDYLGHRTGNMKFWRRMVPSVGMAASVVLLVPAAFSDNQLAAIGLFTASFFCLDATISVFWAIAMDIGGAYASTASGWMNTWANVGGIVSPLVFGVLVDYAHSWTLPFLVASGLMLIGAALVWLINPDDRLEPRERRAERVPVRAVPGAAQPVA